MTALLCAVSMLFCLSGCKAEKEKRYQAEFLTLFDTVTQIISYTCEKEQFSRFSQYVYDQLKVYHEMYDIYHTYDGINNIKTINDAAGKYPVKVDKKIIDLLQYGKEMYAKTGGKMNIALGSVLTIWHEYRENGIDDPENAQVPPTDLLEAAAEHTDINKMIIDTDASTVYLDDGEMSLDVGSVGKGYATEQVCLMAETQGFTNGLVSVGGNVRAIGDKTGDGTPWNVGIQNPDTESTNKILYNVNLSGASLVTSGNYERYYTVDGRRYHHIIDPATLMPSNYFTAVTIITTDSGLADCLTTALFNMPFEEGKAFAEDFPGVEALWVGLDGSVRFSSGFASYLRE